MLMPCSGLLLSHYITETAPTMTTWLGAGNSCLSSVLPIAYIDDLAMHSVIALGGAHLCSRKTDNTELTAATKCHYAFVLRGVRLALHELQPEDTMKVLRILLVLVLVAHYEVRLPLPIILLILTSHRHVQVLVTVGAYFHTSEPVATSSSGC
jgi:hypothetical protein